MTYEQLFKNSKFRWLIFSILLVIPFEILSFCSVNVPLWIHLPVSVAIIAVFGRRVFVEGVQSLFRLDFSDINLLMTIATLGALYLRQFEEAVIIVVLFALGDTLEEFGLERSQSGLKRLIEGAPKHAQIRGTEGRTPVENVRVGEVLVIKPGEQIPLDGKVIAGDSLVDETAITGEPLPRNKYAGDTVYAGTMNGLGYLEVEVMKQASDTTLAKIIDLTYKSLEKKAKFHTYIEIFARFYTPSVVFASLLLVLVPVLVLGRPFDRWFTQSLTLLIIACPCALVISVPVTIFSAIGNAAQKGAIVKGGRFIEEIGKIKAIAFDKTRTLTRGEPIVSDVIAFNGFTEEEIIACAAGMESFSDHPIAGSITALAEAKRLTPHLFTNFRAVPGKGLVGQCTVCFDKEHCLGNLRFVAEGSPTEEVILKKVEEFENQGKTAIVMSGNNTIKGLIGVTDEIRKESKSTIEALQRMNVRPVILTGDNSSSTAYVAQLLGIEETKAQLLPEQKVEELTRLIARYGHVAMVGDGVNDAPALAAASVGIAMGAIGSDVAIENADIALMNDQLETLPYLVGLGRRCVQKVRFNVGAAVVVKFLFLLLAIAGWSNLALAIFADVGVTIIVILNGLTLYGYKGTT